jgi:predicted SAM-dependent methyltransferase
MKLNLGSGYRPIDGYLNLDKKDGWFAEEGIPYENESIDSISISHLLMYIEEKDLIKFLKDIYRVLKFSGIVRITEDDSLNPKSERYNGNPNDPDLKTLLGPEKIKEYLKEAGFKLIYNVAKNYTSSNDIRMLQNHHGDAPKVFFMEAIK